LSVVVIAMTLSLTAAPLRANAISLRALDNRCSVRGRRSPPRMEQVSATVLATPIVVKSVLRDANTPFDSSWADVMRDVRAQEITLSDTVSAERQAAMDALDVERAAVGTGADAGLTHWNRTP
jgi:hypothetical protein